MTEQEAENKAKDALAMGIIQPDQVRAYVRYLMVREQEEEPKFSIADKG